MNIQNADFSSFYRLKRPLYQLIRAQAAILFIALLMLTLAPRVWADAGHDHGDAPAVAAGTTLPRVTSHSDLFELVGVVDKGEMTIFLDRYATNEPVKDAKIEIEIGNIKGIAAVQADGSYLFKNDVLASPASWLSVLPYWQAKTLTCGHVTGKLAARSMTMPMMMQASPGCAGLPTLAARCC